MAFHEQGGVFHFLGLGGFGSFGGLGVWGLVGFQRFGWLSLGLGLRV